MSKRAFALSVMVLGVSSIISGCNISFDPKVLAEREQNRKLSEQRAERGEYQVSQIKPYQVSFGFSKNVKPNEVIDYITDSILNLHTRASNNEKVAKSQTNVPGSTLTTMIVNGVRLSQPDQVAYKHVDQLFTPSVGVHNSRYILEYFDGEQWDKPKYKNLKNIRTWHFELDISVDTSAKHSNVYTVALLPQQHFTNWIYGTSEAVLNKNEPLLDAKKRIDSTKNISIIKLFKESGEFKVLNDDVTAFANVQRHYADNYQRKLSTNSKVDSEKYGVVNVKNALVEFKLYPYKSRAIVTYDAKIPFAYKATAVKKVPEEYKIKHKQLVLNEFKGVLNL